jgi:ribosome-associated protein
MKSLKLLNIIAQAIYDKKGFNILALDIRGVSSITDYIVIAEGSVERHIKSIADEVIDKLYEVNEKPSLIEGLNDSDWVVIDYLNIIVHLFKPDIREKYGLERIWKDGKIVNLEIITEDSRNV